MSNHQYETELVERIKENNPLVVEWVSKYSFSFLNPTEIATPAILVYDLLERSGYIPRVSTETMMSITEEVLKNKSQKDYTISLVERLQEDNPCVVNFISQIAVRGSTDPQATAYGALLVYRFLEKQAELDALKRPEEKTKTYSFSIQVNGE